MSPRPRPHVPLLLAFALGVVASDSHTGFAGDPPKTAPGDEAMRLEVDKLLTDVASDRFEVRDAARKRLATIARSARAALEARKDDPDAEIRRTVASLLEGLGRPETAPTATSSADLASLGLVTVEAAGALSDVMKGWDILCGGRLRLPPSAESSPVKVAVRARPYFEALDAMLSQARAEIGDGFDEAGQGYAIARDALPAAPTAYSGAFRLDLDSVNATRAFRQGPPRRYSLTLRAMWSPDVQVVSYSAAALVRAEDAAGKSFRSSDPGNVFYGAPGRRSTSIQLILDPEDDAGTDRIAVLETKIKFRIRHGRQEAHFRDLSATALPAVLEVAPRGAEKARPTKVTLESFGPDPERRGSAIGVVTVALSKGVSGDGVSGAIETADGLLRPMYDLSSRITGSDGVLRLTVRAPGITPENPAVSLRIVWFALEDEVAPTFVLKDVPLR